jgi:hypothetical protein
MDFLSSLDTKDWITVIATLLGPILAVQAQKFLEQIREHQRRKAEVFEQLMATRAAVVAPEHVRALNMIDLVFYGKRRFGKLRRTSNEQSVLDCWKEYFSHLNETVDEQHSTIWDVRRRELLTNLLQAVAIDTGFNFDRVQLRQGLYSPIAHSHLEEEQIKLRRALTSLVSGETPLQMEVTSFPSDPATVEAYKLAVEGLAKAFKTGALEVSVSPDPQGK